MAHQHAAPGTGWSGAPGQQVQAGGQQVQSGGQQTQIGGQQVAGRQAGGISGTQPGQEQFGGSQAGGPMTGQGVQEPQPGGAGTQAGVQRGPGTTLDDGLTGPTRVALHDVIKAIRVCEWCADQCIDEGPEMARCIRLCRDVAGLAELTSEFLIRDSMFGSDVARTFAEAAEECARECRQHSHEHCQECARELPRAAETVRELVATAGAQPQLPAGGQ